MEHLLLVILIFVLVILITWFSYANNITFIQRIRIIDKIENQYDNDKDYNAFKDKLEVLKGVSYSKHMFYIMTFRNPMQLYDFWIK